MLLTFSCDPISAPFSNSSETVAMWPFFAAKCKEVPPIYNSNAKRQCTDVAHKYIAYNNSLIDIGMSISHYLPIIVNC